ncbi:hypothetical protein ACFCXA_12540 [Streptomyces virginiae]|uniref:hypothetical protein n=1 Tax=Streptomyces virginiae TaxID=1961 RepID=UPI0035D8592F
MRPPSVAPVPPAPAALTAPAVTNRVEFLHHPHPGPRRSARSSCWPLLATVRATESEVTWSGFHQIHRPQWGELPLGPYVFSRPAYEAALAAPVPLAQDPLAPLPGQDTPWRAPSRTSGR